MKLVPFITLLILSGFLVETNHYGLDSVPYNDRDSTIHMDLAFILEDSLLQKYCADNFSSNNYNCDSIIRVDVLSNDHFKDIQPSVCDANDRFYGVSFSLEEDYIYANVLVYRLANDSIWLYSNHSHNEDNYNLKLMFSRKWVGRSLNIYSSGISIETDTLSYYDCQPFLYKGLDSLVTRNPELEGRIRGIILLVDTLGVLNRHQVTLNVEGDMLNQEDYMFLFDYLNQKNYTKCVQMTYPRSELKKFKEYKLSLGYK